MRRFGVSGNPRRPELRCPSLIDRAFLSQNYNIASVPSLRAQGDRCFYQLELCWYFTRCVGTFRRGTQG